MEKWMANEGPLFSLTIGLMLITFFGIILVIMRVLPIELGWMLLCGFIPSNIVFIVLWNELSKLELNHANNTNKTYIGSSISHPVMNKEDINEKT